jgi:YVTN family beta-propeller protein
MKDEPEAVISLFSAFTATATLSAGGTGSIASISGTPTQATKTGTYTVDSSAGGALVATFTPNDGSAATTTRGSITAGGTNTTLIPGLTLTGAGALAQGTDTIVVGASQQGFAKTLLDYIGTLTKTGGLLRAAAVVRASAAMLSVDGHDIATSSLPETLALAAGGSRLATAGATGGVVQVFAWDGTSEVDVTVGGRPVRVVFSPDGSLLAVARSAASSVALVDGAGRVRLTPVAGTPDGLAFSLDGTLLYVADMASGRVTVVDVSTGRALAAIPAGRSAGSLLVLEPPRRR